MGCVLSHVLRGLVVVLGLSAAVAQAQTCTPVSGSFADQGLAFQACRTVLSCALAWQNTTHNVARAGQACAQTSPTAPYTCSVFIRSKTTGVVETAQTMCQTPSSTGASSYSWSASCSTRPRFLGAAPGDVQSVCHNGCRYSGRGTAFFEQDNSTSGEWLPDGTTCAPTVTQPAPTNPPDPARDTDGDGVPDQSDERPNDPACAVGCGPRPGETAPQQPNDNQDDGGQTVAALGPKLDKIEQAVLGLGPRITEVRQAVENARADANTDADRMVTAIDAVAAAVRAQGPNVPGGDPGEQEPLDLSPLTPGADGGPHPGLSSIVETGDGQAMLAQLDTDGWSLTRSCPAYAWPLSFELGWGVIDISEAVELVCSAMAILGWVIGLAGLIQASFILSRVGGGS